MINKFRILFLAIVLMMSIRCYSTDRSGNLIDNDIWKAANSSYNFIGDTGVPSDFTLPVEASVTIQTWVPSIEFALNDETDFIAFSLPAQTREAIIDLNNHTIDIEVASGANIESLVSTFSLSTGASAKVGSVTQISGTTQNDFSIPVTYSVSSESGALTQDWLVNIFIRTEGLIAYYPFDGNAKDQSTNSLHGNVVGATLTADRFGLANSAYYFDGNDFIACGASTVFDLGKYSAYTISAWIKPDESPSGSSLAVLSRYLSSGDSRFYTFALVKESKEIFFITYENGMANPRNNVSVGYNDSWQHVVVIKDNDKMKLYLNLSLVSEVPVTVTMKEDNTDTYFVIGARHGSSTLWDSNFEGVLDDILIYDRALSNTEMPFLYGADSQATDVAAFGFSEQTTAETINASMHTIDLTVTKGTDVTALSANFTLSFGASVKVGSVTQVSGTTLNDFTHPVTYRVTAEDGDTNQDWEVRVEKSLSSATDMVDFSHSSQIGTVIIDATNHTVNLEVANGTEITSLTPNFTLSTGATAKVSAVNQVSGITPNDFSQSVDYKVTAEDGVTIQDWTVTIRVNGAPAFLSINYSPTYEVGSGGLSGLTVTALIASENALSSVIIYHKELTASTYSQIEMSLVGDQHTYSFGNNDFDKLGLTFYISVEDINGNLVLSDNQIISTIAQEDVESIPDLISSTDLMDYAIISIPYQTSAVADVFAALGPNEDGSWKLSHHDGSEQYQYYPADFTHFEPGNGYWFLSSKPTGFLLKGGLAVPVSDDSPFTIQLRANDWNMIGNPFPYSIDWQTVIDHNANNVVSIESLVTFKNRQYKAGQIALHNYDGALLYSSTNVELEIPLSAISSTSGRVTSISNRNNIDGFDTGDWEIGLNLSSDELAYNVSAIAMRPDALDGRDQNDWPMLPRLGAYLDLTFEQGITKSVVAAADSYTWDFTVNSSKKGGSIELTWESLDLSDYNHSLSLLDIANQTIIDMGERSRYDFNQNSESHAFKILYAPKGAPEYLDFGYSFVGNPFPNPFNRDLTVPISIIESDAVVRVTINNILGKKVYQLEQSNINEGYHHFLLKLSEEPLISNHSGTYILNVFIQSKNGVRQVNKRIIFNR